MDRSISETFIFRLIVIIILFIGAGLIFSRLMCDEYYTNVYFGVFFILLDIVFIYLFRRKKANYDSNKASLYYVLMPLITMCCLEITPNSILLQFSDGPDRKVIESFSYLSLIPLGFATFYPILTVISTTILVIRCTLAFQQKKNILYLNGYDLFLNLLIILLSFSALPMFGPNYLSPATCCIAIVSCVNIFLVVTVKRYSRKNTPHPPVR